MALATLIAATSSSTVSAAPVEKPVAGQQARFQNGHWSALPPRGAERRQGWPD
jgi:hypothetical protein